MTTRIAPGARILVVEDEPEFADLIALWLTQHDWVPLIVGDGREAVERFDAEHPDLVLLDVSLPGLDGWRVTERIRATSDVPLLLVTARGSEEDKLRGLGAGADDYITKPLSFPELIARIEACLRRAGLRAAGPDGLLRSEGLVLDPDRHRVSVDGREVHLTPTEFRLLRHLAERPDRLVSHRELLETVWGAAYREETHLLQVTIRNLRSKLAAAAPERHFVTTVYGIGYRFATE
ncbi:MAG TPA: response regulator transcription factor [Candidatus Limnocylindrales bacterium]